MTLIRLGLVPFLMLVLVACGDDGGGTDTSTGGDTGTDTGGGDAGDTGTSDGGGTGTGDAGDTGTGDGGGGTACITHLDPACGPTEYCDFPDNLCGMGEAGVCTARPTMCSDEFASSCACNGLVYMNGCAGMEEGFDLDNNGACTPPAETFTCGSRVCRLAMEYCVIQVSDIGGEPDTYGCEMLPASCSGSADCSCFDAGVACADMCAVDGGNFTLTCPGG